MSEIQILNKEKRLKDKKTNDIFENIAMNKIKIKIVWFKDLERWDTGYFFGSKSFSSRFKLEFLEKILTPRKEKIKKDEYDGTTPIVAKIPFLASHIEYRKEPRTKMEMYAVYKGDLLVSNINFHQGAIAICEDSKVYASTHYQPYIINTNVINSQFLILVLKQSWFQKYVATKKVKGIKTESNFNFIKNLQIPLPPLEIQNKIVKDIQNIQNQIKALQAEEKRLKDEIEAYIYIALGLQRKKVKEKQRIFIMQFKDLDRWDIKHNQNSPCIAPFPCGSASSTCHFESPSCHSDASSCHSEGVQGTTEESKEIKDNATSNSGFFANAQYDNVAKNRDISAFAMQKPQYDIATRHSQSAFRQYDHTYSHSERSEESQNPIISSDSETSHRDISIISLPQNEDTPKYPLVALGEILAYERPDKYIVNNEKYNDKFKIPVLTAGKSFILGYTNETNNIFKEYPVIIFDDFTTATKFVNFEFKVKSSAMKILKNKDETISNIKFIFYAMQTIKLDLSLALRRYWISLYQNLKIPLPPLKIQQEIVEFIENKNQKIQSCKEKRNILKEQLNLTLKESLL